MLLFGTHCAKLLPPQARSQAEDFVFEWDEDEEEGEDDQTLNLFEERMAAQAAAEAASGQFLLDQVAVVRLPVLGVLPMIAKLHC